MATATAAELKEELADLREQLGQVRQPAYPANGPVTKGFGAHRPGFHPAIRHGRYKSDPSFGFSSLNEFAKGVHRAGEDNNYVGEFTERIRKAATDLNETITSEGGFLVPPEFSNQIFERVYANDLLSRCDQYTVGGNQMAFLANAETSRADGSRFGGVSGVWLDEATQIPHSKPTFRRMQLTLRRLSILCYTTEELLQDSAVSLEQYLIRMASQEIEFKVGNAIYRGDGVGKPLGWLSSPCKIAVAKRPGQGAATLLTENIVDMWARMWIGSRGNSIWIINQDVEAQLLTMSLGVGTGGVVTYMPPGGLSGAPYATLMGRPVIVSEFASTLGTEGDIMLVDPSQYCTISKGNIDSAMSIHLRFDYAESAFRFIFRIDGQPWWNAPLTPYQGTNTKSPIITLATR